MPPARRGYRLVVLPEMDLRLEPTPRAPQEARRGIEALRPALDDPLVDAAVLLVSEVVTNSVRHARLDRTDPIEVRLRRSRSGIRVEVIDVGTGFDPVTARRANGDGGWGLRLLDRVSSRWGVNRNDETTVWFELGLVFMNGEPGKRPRAIDERSPHG